MTRLKKGVFSLRVLHQNSILFFSKPGSCLDILVDQGDNITQYVCKKNTPEFLVHIIGIFQATAKKSTFCPVFDSQLKRS